ncbi:fumarylacetoacetate hydrolase family protein [Variovorax sp. AFSI2.2]|uniref:fumarylacetoacetate hydrolase family protein n=1 Tax=Variovorax sp. AFSI2.2 TaxID=3384160 RepID=UPI003EBB5DBA
MPRILLRCDDGTRTFWAVQFGPRLAPLDIAAATTGELLSRHWAALWEVREDQATVPLAKVRVLAPVTTDQQFLCQGVNYRSHVKESGLKLSDFPFNTLFTKASSCITPADAPVVRPANVQLLDYEIELGLVLRHDIPAGTVVAPDRLHEWLAGVTIVNDLSARDVQLPQGQFYKGKSFRGFGPVGPGIVLLSADEWKRWPQLRMRLAVNGRPRQDGYCGDMIHQPAATLTELASIVDLHAGDLIATGTPAGCAARAPGKLVLFVMRHFLGEAGKWRAFIAKGRSNPMYLRPGDRLSATIRTDDGSIDLGEQTTAIVAP